MQGYAEAKNMTFDRIRPAFTRHSFLALLFACMIGRLYAELPPDAQEDVKKGKIAAGNQDYPLAIRFFQDARKAAPDAPEIYYYLGLAESKIPGRELRSICWFEAYLAATTNAPNAAAVKDEIDVLDVKSLSNISRLIKSGQDAAAQIPGFFDKEIALTSVAGLWAEAGDVTTALQIANLEDEDGKKDVLVETVHGQARAGDIAGAQKTAGLIQYPRFSVAQRYIAEAQTKAGDFAGALKTTDLIQDAFLKNDAQKIIAAAQTKAGDFTGALKTAELIQVRNDSDAYNKHELQIDIAKARFQAGDIAGAKNTTDSIKDLLHQTEYDMDKNDLYLAIAETQTKACDFAGALKTADSISRAWRKCQTQITIAEAQTASGDIAGAQLALRSAEMTSNLHFEFNSNYEPTVKCHEKTHIARNQIYIGDFPDARQTLVSARQSAEAMQEDYMADQCRALRDILRFQLQAGDITGAQQTLTSVQRASTSDLITASWKDGVKQMISQSASEIAEANTKAGATNNPVPIVSPPTVVPIHVQPVVSVQPVTTRAKTSDKDWVQKLDDNSTSGDCALNSDPFLDLAGYLTSRHSDDPQILFNLLESTTMKIIEARNIIDQMIKQQAKQQSNN